MQSVTDDPSWYAPAILITTVPFQFQPMPLLKRAAPFDDPDWIYELKMDGFRALGEDDPPQRRRSSSGKKPNAKKDTQTELRMSLCEVVEVRNSADADGIPCPRTASTRCFDRGSELCESHMETCGICHSIFCPATLVLPSSRARKARLSGSRTTFGSESSPPLESANLWC